MSTYDYDLFVLGAGSGGVRAARLAAAMGKRVAVCESMRVGGTCVLRGCVPKKLLVYGAHVSEELEDASAYGWDIAASRFDWQRLICNKNRELDRLNRIYIGLLETPGAHIIDGRGVFLDAHTLSVEGTRYSAEHILIAVGAWPHIPELPGRELAISSNEALDLPTLPKQIVIVGGGYIAVEFAGIFNGLGSKVNLIYRGEQILRGFDDDIRNHLAEALTGRGVDVRVGVNATALATTSNGQVEVQLTDGSRIVADHVMFATGRHPNTLDLGCEAAGVEIGPGGAVQVDEYSRTSQPHIFAVGDVTDRINLTPVALHEASCFVNTVFAQRPTPVDHHYVASAVFSQPPIACVGFTEAQARDQSLQIDVYESSFRPMKYTLTERLERSYLKMLVDRVNDRVVGVHMLGLDAAEIIQGVAIAMKAGATKAHFDATIGIHPSSAEELVSLRSVR